MASSNVKNQRSIRGMHASNEEAGNLNSSICRDGKSLNVLCRCRVKHTPKSHILLQTLFPLPSGCTLQSLLNTIPFRAGINTNGFVALRHSLQKMSEKDQYCFLLFDEMSIRGNVWFNQKFDCIEGFEDLGSQGRTCNIVNHALLFIVCGIALHYLRSRSMTCGRSSHVTSSYMSCAWHCFELAMLRHSIKFGVSYRLGL